MRWLAVVFVVGCAGGREVSKIRYTSTDCPDPNGCEAVTGEGDPTYQPPDEAHDTVADVLIPVETPSCRTVAVALTAIRVGNYASDNDERQAIFDQQQLACQAAKLDAREIACLSTVTDTTQIGYCTQKLVASTKVDLLDKSRCHDVVERLKPNLYGGAPTAVSYEASCVEDGWSQQLATCISQGYFQDPLQSMCRELAPGWLFTRLEDRLMAAAGVKK